MKMQIATIGALSGRRGGKECLQSVRIGVSGDRCFAFCVTVLEDRLFRKLKMSCTFIPCKTN